SPNLSDHLDPALSYLSTITELSLIPDHFIDSILDSFSLCFNLHFVVLSKSFLSNDLAPSLTTSAPFDPFDSRSKL
ncbi:putative LRR receptor-like serine/threonine-protein kinase ERL1, partial [Cocos nucifera]